jgi:hypothetical protein
MDAQSYPSRATVVLYPARQWLSNFGYCATATLNRMVLATITTAD